LRRQCTDVQTWRIGTPNIFIQRIVYHSNGPIVADNLRLSPILLVLPCPRYIRMYVGIISNAAQSHDVKHKTWIISFLVKLPITNSCPLVMCDRRTLRFYLSNVSVHDPFPKTTESHLFSSNKNNKQRVCKINRHHLHPI
jgi:hypothetical protein